MRTFTREESREVKKKWCMLRNPGPWNFCVLGVMAERSPEYVAMLCIRCPGNPDNKQ
jgi:hypothetical protein